MDLYTHHRIADIREGRSGLDHGRFATRYIADAVNQTVMEAEHIACDLAHTNRESARKRVDALLATLRDLRAAIDDDPHKGDAERIRAQRAAAKPHYFDDPEEPGKNEDRAGWAQTALEAFATETGLDLEPDADGPETALGDLLANLGHYCDRNGLELSKILRTAEMQYNAETGNQGKQFGGLLNLTHD